MRVKRSMKKEKQTNKSDGPGVSGRTGRGPQKGPGRETGGGRLGFKSQKKFSGKQQWATKGAGSFKGEMVDPNKKPKKKGLKKKGRHNKKVHI